MRDGTSSIQMLEMPILYGSFTQVPAGNVSVTECLRKLVREGLQQIGGGESADRARNEVTAKASEEA